MRLKTWGACLFGQRFIYDKKENQVQLGRGVRVQGRIVGEGNTVIVKDSKKTSSLTINITGNGNYIEIDETNQLKGLVISIGSNVGAHGCRLSIGPDYSCENGCKILLYNQGNVCSIGKSCMFSKNITIRGGELPHLIFDRETGKYLDVSEGVLIGDHVWVGEDSYITKKVTIPAECVVGARSVVTRRFSETNCAIAGNPAVIVRENIQWIRNLTLIDTTSIYYEEYKKWDQQAKGGNQGETRRGQGD